MLLGNDARYRQLASVAHDKARFMNQLNRNLKLS